LGAPIVHRGGGTGLTGNSCNVAVLIDHSKFLRNVLDVDPTTRTARVEAGVVLDDLRRRAQPHGLTFGPDPATHDRCTLGGMLGNNSCGMHAQMAGRVVDNVHELDVLTYDGLRLTVGAHAPDEIEAIIRAGGRRGAIYQQLRALRDRYGPLIRERFPPVPRRVSGYNLDELLPENGFHVARSLVGTEGTCVTLLGAKLRLVHAPSARSLLTAGFDDVYAAARAVPELLPLGPIGLEGLDERLVEYVRLEGGGSARSLGLLPRGHAFLMIEFDGVCKEEADAKARRAMAALRRLGREDRDLKLYDDPGEEAAIWAVRESGLGATAFVPGMPVTWPGWEDAAVPPDHLEPYLRSFRALLDRYGYDCSVYGHFGQGCVHCRITFDLSSEAGVARYRAFVGEAAELVVRHGGSLSGEHGDGQSRAELLPKMFGPELVEAMGAFKAIWDPDGRMNPGRVVDPQPLTASLRTRDLGALEPASTRFRYAEAGGFELATRRCVGVGKCRREQGGYMCPSFMATREEKHSTRGRARLLFEMLRGDVVRSGWRDPAVKEALDLCLSCKGCKSDCPVHVDMATLKAEFLAHYYEGRLRPRPAYAMGLIYWWARVASVAPSFANLVTQTPGLSHLARGLAGLTLRRPMPPFATETFRRWFARRAPARQGPEVLLWADTFSNFFHPAIAKAAVDVLEDAGFTVRIAARSLCCGRPLYDYGFLDLARRQLRQTLDTLAAEIDAGVPVVVLEPSCASVFRDELRALLPDDVRAGRLASQVVLLSEFLERHASDYRLPKLARRALVQVHCHHHAIAGERHDLAVFERMGLAAETTREQGCCGLAGSFGFERDKFDVAQAIGERGLLPRVRAAADEMLVLGDGFSCRTQIEQTGRHALHLAEVVHLGLAEEGRLTEAQRRRDELDARRDARANARARWSVAGAAVLVTAALWRRRRQRRGDSRAGRSTLARRVR
jgi:FAD/FMN-containing dehydrogenase/Fe-S oxidoreductase